jgi:hypothetical protein
LTTIVNTSPIIILGFSQSSEPGGRELMIDQIQYPAAPDFSATDSEGKPIELAGFKGLKNVVLVFNRGFF